MLTAKLVRAGLAQWSGGRDDNKSLIVRGQSRLLDDLKAVEDVERIRLLFEDLEFRNGRCCTCSIFPKTPRACAFSSGSENNLFSLSLALPSSWPRSRIKTGKSLRSRRSLLGLLNHARIIPMVDYTAKLLSRVLA